MKYTNLKRISVFCGSSLGNDVSIVNTAKELGRILAINGIELIYGGADVGLMSVIANSALEAGGEVTGIIPHYFITGEIAHRGLTNLISVDSLQERKSKMAEMSDGFISLPGGYGTMDELFEVLTWCQLGIYKKPSAILNLNGYYDGLMRQIGRMTETELLKSENRDMVIFACSPEEALDRMNNWEAPKVSKWIHSKNQ